MYRKNVLCFLLIACSFASAQIDVPKINEAKYESVYPGLNIITISQSLFSFKNLVGLYENNKPLPDIDILNPIYKEDFKVPFVYSNLERRVMVLKNNKVCICLSPSIMDGIDEPFFYGINITEKTEYDLCGAYYLSASSVLVENGKKYSPNKLGVIKLESPWSEGVEGDGIGEYLMFGIGFGRNRIGRPLGIYLINGYISFSHPERYILNNRIKKMKIESLSTGKSKTYNVFDSPNPQFFSTEELGGYEFKLTIEEVYSGEKFQDTCISGIISLTVSWEGVVPPEFFEQGRLKE